MKNHVWRPLFVVIGIIIFMLLFRAMYVPDDFGVHGDSFMYNYSEDLHGTIACQNCHGPALDHPEEPEALTIDRSRETCLRCHTALPYTTSERKRIPGIINEEHNPGEECVLCHNPHNPRLEDM